MTEATKFCSRCGETKPLGEFHQNRSTRDGLQCACKPCRNAAGAVWRGLNAELHREINAAWDAANMGRKRAGERAWRKANLSKERLADAERRHRRRARKRGATVGVIDPTALWAACGGTCGLCGVSIDVALAWPDPGSKSIDHILPLSKGGSHSQENVQWAHLVCNTRKGNRLARGIK